MLRTALFEEHQKLGAKFTEFGGWEMPVQYSGVVDEHLNVRKNCGIFDVSHMGEIEVTGADALTFLQYVSSNDLSKIPAGKAQYGLLLNEQGGAVDDIIIYKIGDQQFFICVNASNIKKDFDWLVSKRGSRQVEVKNASTQFGQIAIQGPKAAALVGTIFGLELSRDKFPNFTFRFLPQPGAVGAGSQVLVARTGYTGEDGFELYAAPEVIKLLWQSAIELGSEFGLKPVGLGARDSLRLEASLPLYGHELREDVCALSANVAWAIKLAKGDFIGRDALLKIQAQGVEQKLVGLEVVDPGIVREGAKLFHLAGASDTELREVGWVTSGTKPPTVDRAVALAYVESALSGIGNELWAEVRGRKLRVRICETPFYKRVSS